MPRAENLFAWSASRGAALALCPRLYFWSYYGSWRWPGKRASPETREANRLKKLWTWRTWASHVVHDVVRRAVDSTRCGRSVNAVALMQEARTDMWREWWLSAHSPREKRGARGFCGLLEHEYGIATLTDGADAMKLVMACLEAFFASGILARLAALSLDEWLEVDRGADGFPFWELDGVRIYSAPDLVIIEAGAPVVYEWKTGAPKDADQEQVLGHALSLASLYPGLQPESVTGRVVYMSDGARVATFSLTAERLEAYRAKVRAEVALGERLLADVARNVPLSMVEFRQTEDAGTCATCAFRRMCGR